MLTTALQTLIGTALVDVEFCEELAGGKHVPLSMDADLVRKTGQAIKIGSIQELIARWQNKSTTDVEAFLVESLAWGLLQAYAVGNPPVPVREMVENPLPIFENLTLLEVNLGLYKATYRSCLDGSRLIIVDRTTPAEVQRESIARELYVAFCHSSRASELHWFGRDRPHVYSTLFAHCLLMPAPWTRQACAEAISTEGLAARFSMPIRSARERLSQVVRPSPPSDLGESLAEMMFSLEEPWRGRFLELTANMAMNRTRARRPQQPTKKEVVNWLSTNPSLYQDMRYMLNSWHRSWNVWLTTSLVQA
jgi:hypothetical protein